MRPDAVRATAVRTDPAEAPRTRRGLRQAGVAGAVSRTAHAQGAVRSRRPAGHDARGHPVAVRGLRMKRPADAPLTVVKVGGSLVADPPRLRAVLADVAAGREGAAVIVPGGGPFADAVRTTQAALRYDDALAHRLALDAMARMAEVFRAVEPRLAPPCDADAIPAAVRAGTVPVWSPTALKAGVAGIDETWSVTSDSLALWLALRLGAARCVLVKSAPAPAGEDPEALARRGLVDAAFPGFAAGFSGAIEIRGAGAVP